MHYFHYNHHLRIMDTGRPVSMQNTCAWMSIIQHLASNVYIIAIAMCAIVMCLSARLPRFSQWVIFYVCLCITHACVCAHVKASKFNVHIMLGLLNLLYSYKYDNRDPEDVCASVSFYRKCDDIRLCILSGVRP